MHNHFELERQVGIVISTYHRDPARAARLRFVRTSQAGTSGSASGVGSAISRLLSSTGARLRHEAECCAQAVRAPEPCVATGICR